MTFFSELLVTVPIADLRREPRPSLTTYGKDPLQETQLLLGERLRLIEENDDWIYIEALEQTRYSALKGWQGYHGWLPRAYTVPANYSIIRDPGRDIVVTAPWAPIFANSTIASPVIMEISLGTCLTSVCQDSSWWKVALPDGTCGYVAFAAAALCACSLDKTAHIGSKIAGEAQKFLGSPYHWGGRSAYRPAQVPLTGVDCSGLSNLLHRLHGIDIPRDAHDQFLKCHRKSHGAQLQPGDLIFSRAEGSASGRIDHVMVYAGGNEVVEATLAHGQVKRTNIKESWGCRLSDIADGDVAGRQTIFFGSYLGSA